MVVTVRIISNVSSHSNIFVEAVIFRNLGNLGLVESKLASDMKARPPDG